MGFTAGRIAALRNCLSKLQAFQRCSLELPVVTMAGVVVVVAIAAASVVFAGVEVE